MATWTLAAGGGDWNNNATWAEGGGYPVAGDDVVINSSSGNVTVNATSACATLIASAGSTTAMTVSSPLTVSSTFTLVSGMTVTGASYIYLNSAAGCTITSGGVTIGCALWLGGNGITKTLGDNWSVSGLVRANTSGVVINSNTLTSSGGLTLAGGVSGTTKIILTGGTWQGTAGLSCSLDLQGGVTISGVVTFQAGTLTYVSGTITTTGSELRLATACTVNTAGVSFNHVSFTNNSATTFTINSLLTAGGAITAPNQTTTFAGTAGFTCATFQGGPTSVSKTWTFTYGNTYTVTDYLTVAGVSDTIRLTLASSHVSNHVVLNFSGGTPPSLSWVNATRINSNGGTAIYTNGTITTSDNWSAPPSSPTMNLIYHALESH